MMKAVPPLNDLFNMAGLNLPTYLSNGEKEDSSKTENSTTENSEK
jgi:flotillin